MHPDTFQTYTALKHLYLEHPSISNISLSRTSLYLKHFSISNISLSRVSLYLEHPSISNIPLSQTFLYHKHSSISNISFTWTPHPSFSSNNSGLSLHIWTGYDCWCRFNLFDFFLQSSFSLSLMRIPKQTCSRGVLIFCNPDSCKTRLFERCSNLASFYRNPD